MAEVINYQEMYRKLGEMQYNPYSAQTSPQNLIRLNLCRGGCFQFIQGYGYVEYPCIRICPTNNLSSQSSQPGNSPVYILTLPNVYQSLFKPDPTPWAERVSTLYYRWPLPYPPGDPVPWPDRNRIFENPYWQMFSSGYFGYNPNINVQGYIQPSFTSQPQFSHSGIFLIPSQNQSIR